MQKSYSVHKHAFGISVTIFADYPVPDLDVRVVVGMIPCQALSPTDIVLDRDQLGWHRFETQVPRLKLTYPTVVLVRLHFQRYTAPHSPMVTYQHVGSISESALKRPAPF